MKPYLCVLLFIPSLLWGLWSPEDPQPIVVQGVEQIRQELDKLPKSEEDLPSISLLNVSYDPTRELYREYNEVFLNWWKGHFNQELTILQSHGGSGKQARSVITGLDADVVTLALALDIDRISIESGKIPKDWASRLPNSSVPYYSTIIFLVREGNPKGIKDWGDLVREDVSVITPNPKTSGGARWNYMAAWGYAVKAFQGDEQQAINFMAKLFHNVPILDSGARASTITFVSRHLGDVLITWENEALLANQKMGDDRFDLVYPSASIYAAPPVAWVDGVVTKKKTLKAAECYLKYLYTRKGQEIAAKHYYRTVDISVLDSNRKLFPIVPMFKIEDFGGWEQVNEKHFISDGIFDKIFEKSK